MRYRHDLAIVDISLEGASGLNLISTFATQYSHIPVLVMSMHEESQYAERCLRLGAKGYIMKHQAVVSIQSAIRRILAGGIYLSDDMQKRVLDRMGARRFEQATVDLTASLTNASSRC